MYSINSEVTIKEYNNSMSTPKKSTLRMTHTVDVEDLEDGILFFFFLVLGLQVCATVPGSKTIFLIYIMYRISLTIGSHSGWP